MNKKSIVSVIVGLVCVAITAISAYSAISRSFFDIPVFDMLLGEEEMDQTREEIDQYLEDIEDLSDEEIEAFEDETGVKYNRVMNLLENPSINNLIDVGGKLEDFGVDDEAIDLFKTIRTVLVVYGVVIAFFSLMGALFRKKALTILALIIAIPFYIFIVGWLMFALFAVASIVHVVLVSKEKKAAAAANI